VAVPSQSMSHLTAHSAANDYMDASAPAGGGGDSRADVLHRIREALRGAAPGDVPRDYRTENTREGDEIVDLFAERVAEYRATVHPIRESEVAEAVERIARDAGAKRIGIPADLPSEWRPGAGAPQSESGGSRGERSGGARIELVEDDSLSVPQLDEVDGALTRPC
jgi:L-lactate dehydrogenase complex protein LldG